MNPLVILFIVLISLALGLVGGYYLRGWLPARRWLARRGLAWRGVADEADPEAEAPDAAAPMEPPLPPALRLEAAAPQKPVVGRPFELLVGLLPHDDPRALPDLLREAAEPGPSPSRALRFRVRLDAPDFDIDGPAEQPARWWPDGPPFLLAFRLSPRRPDSAPLRLVVYQGLREAGRARLTLRAVAPALTMATATPDGDPAAPPLAPSGSAAAIARATITIRAPEAADHLLAHAIAESYAADELAALIDELGAPPPVDGASPFIVAIDLVTHAARHGDPEALAVRLAAERPHWRAAIRGNRRAERLVV